MTKQAGKERGPEDPVQDRQIDPSQLRKRLETRLPGRVLGRIVQVHRRVASTMPLAHALVAEAGDPSQVAGALILAEEQTAGRGRLDRRWQAPPGTAILASLVVAGPLLPSEPAQLPMIAGLAVLRTLEATLPGLAGQVGLKWPNDVLLGPEPGKGRKVAGLLVESAFQEGRMAYAVLGMGVNVNQAPFQLPEPRPGGVPPTSLKTFTGRAVNRLDLLVALCQALSQLLEPPDRPEPTAIHEEWQARLVHLGRSVQVRQPSQGAPVTGRGVATTLTGGLVLETEGGQRQVVHAGDATLL